MAALEKAVATKTQNACCEICKANFGRLQAGICSPCVGCDIEMAIHNLRYSFIHTPPFSFFVFCFPSNSKRFLIEFLCFFLFCYQDGSFFYGPT